MTDDDGFDTDETPSNFYSDVYAFVDGFWAQIYAHSVLDQQTAWRWCSRWFHHTEAVARLEGAWKAWEVLRLDSGTGASLWFRDHGDPCLAALTSPDGPFRQCSETKHKNPPVLPIAPIPPGLSDTTGAKP